MRAYRAAGLIGGIALLCIGIIAAGFMWLSGGLQRNVAQDAFAPLGDALFGSGANRVCDIGDAGYRTVGASPRYTAYYLAPNRPRAERDLLAAAASDGFSLEPVRLPNRTVVAAYRSVQSAADGRSAHGVLDVEVYQRATVPLKCAGSHGSRTEKVAGNAALVVVTLTEPPRPAGP
ncbi:hypothetical protein [Curtobacterium ammoniigenes]|uniref:hypothetical protein n=1 Tax=Curtobacterium ammoniigenes TaxID=395387 RepID=UPI00082F4F18|nr:hypothetical protein [Curtobacterium ammoniigenes]